MTGLRAADAASILARIRARRPLVHHVTNVVTVNDVANVTLALGAAPVMAQAPEEVEEMVAGAAALALNTGTPTAQAIEAMLLAGRRANAAGIPVILDPVGVGATAFRTAQVGRVVAAIRIACVRGNAGEIAALAGHAGGVRGVDAAGGAEIADRLAQAQTVARRTGAAVAATGPVDLVTDGARVARIDRGHPLLAQISGSGCMVTAVIAACAAVEPDALAAAAAGLLCFAIAAECAAETARGPGTFRAGLIDSLAALDARTVLDRGRMRA